MNDIKLKVKQLEKAHDKIERLEKELHHQLKPFVQFDFAVTYCAGDGFCILNNGGTGDELCIDEVSPVDSCICKIVKHGKLTDKEFSKIII